MAIVLDDITEVDLEGNGSFDVLMRTLRLHIAEAVDDNEITQSEAGAIYTGVIPSIVQEAVQFELQKDLIAQQILTEKQNTENNKLQGILLSRQIANAEKDIETKSQQIDNMKEDNLVKKQEVLSAKANVALVERNVFKVENEAKLVDEQVLTSAKQRDKLDADIVVSSRQVALIEAQATEQLTDTGRKTNWSNKDLEVKNVEIVKANREISKLETEIKLETDKLELSKVPSVLR